MNNFPIAVQFNEKIGLVGGQKDISQKNGQTTTFLRTVQFSKRETHRHRRNVIPFHFFDSFNLSNLFSLAYITSRASCHAENILGPLLFNPMHTHLLCFAILIQSVPCAKRLNRAYPKPLHLLSMFISRPSSYG